MVVRVCCILLYDARTKATRSAYNEYGRHLSGRDERTNAVRISIEVQEVKYKALGEGSR